MRLFLDKTGNLQESRDLLQDLYESVLRSLDSFSVAEDQAAWLFRAAHNKVIDWYRKKARHQDLSLEKEDLEDRSLLDLLVDTEIDLEDRFFRNGLYEALYEAIEALPEKLRVVIVQQSLEGRSFRELSEEWGIPQGTLLSRKREAVRLLRMALEEFEEVWEEMTE
jgi:RNA polymerase sigma factor (sigma-70 family)